VLDILEHHEPMPIPSGVEGKLREIIAQADARHSA
jgi:hypothetical protein